MDVICHYGVKGMKWGVRRYQYADGSLTPSGRRRYKLKNQTGLSKASSIAKMKVSDAIKRTQTVLLGKQYVDTYLKKGITLSRVQTTDVFENFAFYATYKKDDVNKYLGLFGKNLRDRARHDAMAAEKKAKKTGDLGDLENAKALRNKSDKLQVYQLHLKSKKKLRVPSDENATDVVWNLIKNDDSFRKNLEYSIADSKSKMRRPSQQILFDKAQRALRNRERRLSYTERLAVYKAFNLSLVYHDQREVAAQDAFYKAMRKKGYNALLDYNDQQYSSYHAKRPMIVFDVDSVRLDAVMNTNPKDVNRLYRKYNAERIRKETIENTLGIVSKYGHYKVSEASDYVERKVRDYLGG